jgi:hypothetical protein
VGFRAGLDTEARRKILCLCWESNPGRPLCSQTTILTERLHGAISQKTAISILLAASTSNLNKSFELQPDIEFKFIFVE